MKKLKKILYKVKAYHCPRCGGVTEPTKKYCDYCGRDLTKRKKDRTNDFRLLIDNGNYIFYDELKKITIQERIERLDATCLEDTYRKIIQSPVTHDFSIQIPCTERGMELAKYRYNEIHKIRFENLVCDLAYESEVYITSCFREFNSCGFSYQTINFVSIGRETKYDTAIPIEIVKEMRCPNCGAEIRSRYGACPFCSGWSEVSW